MPTLLRKTDQVLVQQWWSQPSFDSEKPLYVPIFNFQTGEFAGEAVELDQQIFNIPLRRDVIHSVYQWYIFKDAIKTHSTRTKGTTAGSGKKMQPQKGSGRARVGNKRAPGRWKGGKAHGPQPRDMSFTIPLKKKLLAIRSLLSAKLAEGNLRIVDSEGIEEGKTKLLKEYLDICAEGQRMNIVTGYDIDINFQRASQNLPNVTLQQPHELDIFDLLKHKKLIITKEGLKQLTLDLQDKQLMAKSPRGLQKSELPSYIERQKVWPVEQEQKPVYDPSKPLELKFKILQDYLQEYEQKRLQEDNQTETNQQQN